MNKKMILTLIAVAAFGAAAMMLYSNKAQEYKSDEAREKALGTVNELVDQANNLCSQGDKKLYAGNDGYVEQYIKAYELVDSAGKIAKDNDISIVAGADTLELALKSRLQLCQKSISEQLNTVNGIPSAEKPLKQNLEKIEALLRADSTTYVKFWAPSFLMDLN